MPATISADFDTRRDAEMAVEHIVQEHGFDRAMVAISPVSLDNSAGTRPSGSDLKIGETGGATGEPALSGRLRVTVQADASSSEKVLASFGEFGGQRAG